MRGKVVVCLLLVLSIASFVHARNFSLPFCGDGKAEVRIEWDERRGEDGFCWHDDPSILPCMNRGTGETWQHGEKCTAYYQSQAVDSICLRAKCLASNSHLLNKQSQFVVMNTTVEIGDPILIYIYDPTIFSAESVYGPQLYLVRETDQGPEYLANFCGKTIACGLSFNNVKRPYTKDSGWDGLVGNIPGGIRVVSDFVNDFPLTVPDEERKKWGQTTINRGPIYFGINEPGEYYLELLDGFLRRVRSDTFTVCADLRNCGPARFEGSVEDGYNNTIRGMRVSLLDNDFNVLDQTHTDDDGNYLLKADVTGNDLLRLRFDFIRSRNNKMILLMYDDKAGNNGTTKNRPINATTIPFRLEDFDSFEEFDFDSQALDRVNLHNPKVIRDMAEIYYLITETEKFAREELDILLDHDRRLEVHVFGDSTSFYSPSINAFFLDEDDSVHGDFETPDNSVFHELGHAIMRNSKIGGEKSLPLPHNGAFEFNHLGYASPTTTDSWEEGFAEFISAVAADVTGINGPGDDKPWLYRYGFSSVRNLEDNIEAWRFLGHDEEFAVASMLWDLYDSDATYGGTDDDKVSIPLKQLWAALNKEHVIDVLSIYGEVKNLDPGVDDIFISHGLFHDANGNWKYDDGEEVGRTAHKASFFTSWDFDSDGNYNVSDVNADIGRLVFGDRTLKSAPTSAFDDYRRFGSVDTDGDGDGPTLVWTPKGVLVNQSHHDTDGDGDFGVVADLDGDGKGEITETVVWVFPYDTRRKYDIALPHRQLEVQVEGDVLFLVEVNYPESPEKDFSYTTKNMRDVFIAPDAVLSLTAFSEDGESETVELKGEDFERRYLEEGKQEPITLKIQKSNTWWIYIVLIVVIIVAFVLFKRKK